MTITFLYGTFRTNEHVCLDMHRVCLDMHRVCLDKDRFCSFDNWLCDPISENWQLTLASFEIFVDTYGHLKSIAMYVYNT